MTFSVSYARLLIAALLTFVITSSVSAEEVPDKSYFSQDKAFLIRLSPEFFKELSPGKSELNVAATDASLMIVVTKFAGQVPLASIKRDFPKRASNSKWKILSTVDSTVGGKPAVYYRLSNVLVLTPEYLKALSLPANSKYDTVMALVPTARDTYTFQVHYLQRLGDKGPGAAMGLLAKMVTWKI